MNWELFYLICFVVGFAFSVLSFLSGALHSHVHLPKHFHLGGSGHGVAHSHGVGHSHGAKGGVKGAQFSFFNPMTMAAFLTWFGGAGYLLSICATSGCMPAWHWLLGRISGGYLGVLVCRQGADGP